ncbi:MAG: tRNA (adenosine(37)-N6)-dimethylallyltransferase MiaA [Planctomycetes bacterium]|nr:tRNA (adenosine(37)-N6)-dimethylallyltransferase MiaA [Planctomycetota bacterium]
MNGARVLFVVGETASGKHEIALALAARLGGEILSLDSMKVYRGMDVGTSKPSPAARAAVPHHLLDLVDPSQEFSVAEYLGLALAAVEDVLARGQLPIFAGGTGLYLLALTRGLFEGPAGDPSLRARILAEAAGPQDLHARLARVDPERANELHPRDVKRIVRAIEIYELSGLPMSKHLRESPHRTLRYPCRIFGIARDPADLLARIASRTERLFAAGFVEEVRRLHADTRLTPGRQAGQAVGYRDVAEFLAGRCDLANCVAEVERSTRRLARRQRTWFRGFRELTSIHMAHDESPARAVERIVSSWTG